MTHYIVFDLEFNQHFSDLKSLKKVKKQCPFEIIQIGAVKLDMNLNTISVFNRYVKPTIYPLVDPYITDLTGITTEQLLSADSFSEVFNAYIEFIGTDDSVFCIWGMTDMKELFKNAEYHGLNKNHLPDIFINLQPYVSTHFGFSKNKLFSLQSAVEALNILKPYPFHNALHDAYYTAEILTKINNSAFQAKRYDPNHVTLRTPQPKKRIDVEKLLQQFEKMFTRELSKEEQNMIILAYQMGKTHQFIK